MANIWFRSSNLETTLEAKVENYDQARQLFDRIDLDFEKQLQGELANIASHEYCACEIGAKSEGFKYSFCAKYDHEADVFNLTVQRGDKKNVLGIIPVNKKRTIVINALLGREVFEYLKTFLDQPEKLFTQIDSH